MSTTYNFNFSGLVNGFVSAINAVGALLPPLIIIRVIVAILTELVNLIGGGGMGGGL